MILFLHDVGKKESKKKIHISFWMTMIKEVYSFSEYAGYVSASNVLETCVSAMERGFLHVDTMNSYEYTLGYMFVDNANIFNKCLWDRYWAFKWTGSRVGLHGSQPLFDNDVCFTSHEKSCVKRIKKPDTLLFLLDDGGHDQDSIFFQKIRTK